MVDVEEKKPVEIAAEEQARRARIEDARKKILTDREKFRGEASKLTNELLIGTDYTEDVIVKLISNPQKYGTVTIRPLSEGEMIGIFAKFGPDKMNSIGKNRIEDYDFYWSVVEKSTGLDLNAMKKSFVMGESVIMGDRVLEISGLGPETGAEVESFPKK